MKRIPNVEINVDRLVLHGVSTSERDQLVAAMKQELARLAAKGIRRLPSVSGGFREHAGTTIEIPAGLTAKDVGRQVASSIWSAWQRGRDTGPASASVARTSPTVRPIDAGTNGKVKPS